MLQHLRTGFTVGLSFLATYVLLEHLMAPPRVVPPVHNRLDLQVEAEVWRVLAEARRITEQAVEE